MAIDFQQLVRTPVVTAYLSKISKRDPTEYEKQIAVEILNSAPRTATPYEIATYLAGVSEENSDGESYLAEWDVRWNPLIVAFFLSTSYSSPEEFDETPWCAAFVNWCFQRSGMAGTGSASSGSFRCEGKAPADPRIGDLAVFRKRGHNQQCSGMGHVAFFVAYEDDHISILGGNQNDRIKVSRYPVRPPRTTAWPILLSIRDWQTIP